MFNRTPLDVIKGIRKGKVDKTTYLTQIFSEVKDEIKSADLHVKANAIKKLFVLAHENYDMVWASFNVLEIMSSNKVSHKRTGFLIASLVFPLSSDTLFLSCNLFRRELIAKEHLDTCIALNCLSCVMDATMAEQTYQDCLTLLSSSKYILRKKVCIVFFKLFYFYPECLPIAFERLVEKLKDDNVGVINGAVSTILEVARHNPEYVKFASKPLYDLLNGNISNWILIKVLKLFTILSGVEPRLLRKLAEPIGRILSNTTSKSVEYEAIICIIKSFTEYPALIQLAQDRITGFIESNDNNLKYLGLNALKSLLDVNIETVAEFRSHILECFSCTDLSIKIMAIEMIKLTTTSDTTEEIVDKFLKELETQSEAQEEIIDAILYIVSYDTYELVEDFQWLVKSLFAVIRYKSEKHEQRISDILLDVVTRVNDVRTEALELCCEQLTGELDPLVTDKCTILSTIIFVIGEYCPKLDEAMLQKAFELITADRLRKLGLPHIVYTNIITSTFKMTLHAASLNLTSLSPSATENFKILYSIQDMEIQQAATFASNILASCDTGSIVLDEFIPVDPEAQKGIEPIEALLEEIKIDENELYTLKEDGNYDYHYFTDNEFNLKQAAVKRTKQPVDSPFYLKASPQKSEAEENKDQPPKKQYKVNKSPAAKPTSNS